MGHGPGRPVELSGRPHGQGGRHSSGSITPHLMGSGPGRPVKAHGPPQGQGGTAPIEPTSHGPRPGPVYPISIRRAVARSGPSTFQGTGRGRARHIKRPEDGPPPDPAHRIFNFSRPGPAPFIKCSKGSARSNPARHNFQIGLARPGPDKRPMTSPGFFLGFLM